MWIALYLVRACATKSVTSDCMQMVWGTGLAKKHMLCRESTTCYFYGFFRY